MLYLFADDIFKCIFLKEISYFDWNFAEVGPINKNPALV